MKATAFLALLALGILVAPLAPDAQPRRLIPLVGVLTPYAMPTAVTPNRDLEAFAQGLRQLGAPAANAAKFTVSKLDEHPKL